MKKQKSFSLVEVLVASAIFAMVLMVVMTLVGNLSSVSLGVKSQQEAISNSQFLMDRISKDVMMANGTYTVNPRIFYGFVLTNSTTPSFTPGGNCNPPNGVCDDFADTQSPKGIIIHTAEGDRFYYFANSKIYYANVSSIDPFVAGTAIDLTPDIEVTSFKVIGSSNQTNNTQPWAKIMITYQVKSGFFKTSKTTYNLETMATVRKTTWP